MTRIGVWKDGMAFMLSTITFIGVGFLVLIYGVGVFRKELNDDTGYLLYSLPVSGYDITGAKLLMATVIYVVYTLLAGLFSWAIFLLTLNDDRFKRSVSMVIPGNILNDALIKNSGIIMYTYISVLLFMIGLWLLSYLSTILSRVFFYKKRFGGLMALGIFIAIAWLIGRLYYVVIAVFPWTYNLTMAYEHAMWGFRFDVPINIAGDIFSVLILVLLYVITSHMVHRRLEL